MREDIQWQGKEEVSNATSEAFRKELDTELESLGQSGEVFGTEEEAVVETQMSASITIMRPILRYLQLLCENHNSDLQVLLV